MRMKALVLNGPKKLRNGRSLACARTQDGLGCGQSGVRWRLRFGYDPFFSNRFLSLAHDRRSRVFRHCGGSRAGRYSCQGHAGRHSAHYSLRGMRGLPRNGRALPLQPISVYRLPQRWRLCRILPCQGKQSVRAGLRGSAQAGGVYRTVGRGAPHSASQRPSGRKRCYGSRIWRRPDRPVHRVLAGSVRYRCDRGRCSRIQPWHRPKKWG